MVSIISTEHRGAAAYCGTCYAHCDACISVWTYASLRVSPAHLAPQNWK